MRTLAYWFMVAVLFLSTVFAWIDPITSVYNTLAAVMVFSPLPIFLLSRLGGIGTLRFIVRLIHSRPIDTDARLVDQLNTSALFSAGIGIAVGNIYILRNLAHPEAIAAGVSASFLCLVYGMMVPILLLPFVNTPGAKALVKRASTFVFLLMPGMLGVTWFALTVARVV